MRWLKSLMVLALGWLTVQLLPPLQAGSPPTPPRPSPRKARHTPPHRTVAARPRAARPAPARPAPARAAAPTQAAPTQDNSKKRACRMILLVSGMT